MILLSIGSIITTLTVRKAQNSNELLRSEAAQLQKNLNEREVVISSFIQDSTKFEEAKSYHVDGAKALNFINSHGKFGINIFTYENNNLLFWSTVDLLPPKNLSSIRDGVSLLHLPSGYYECVKRTDGNFTVLVLITIKKQYSIQNEYLKNEIDPELSPSGLIEIASFNDSNETIKSINSVDDKYLFSVKLHNLHEANFYNSMELWLWVFGLLFFCLFVNSFCNYLARSGRFVLAILVLVTFIVAFRWSDLEYGWINREYDLLIFNPQIYAQSYLFPSLGDLLLNALVLTWFIKFVYNHRDKIQTENTKSSVIISQLIHLLLLILFGTFAYLIDDVFFGLIYNSKIAFDINIVNLNWVSWVCVLLICLAWTNIYAIGVIFIRITYKFPLSNWKRLLVFLSAVAVYTIFKLFTSFTAFYLIYAVIAFLIAYNIYIKTNKFSMVAFVSALFCMAFITSVKYTKFTDIRERTYRGSIAQRLETSINLQLVNAINVLEVGVISDKLISDYYNDPESFSTEVMQNHIVKKYLDGFIGNFEINLHNYGKNELILGDQTVVPLSYYRDLVLSGALKTPESNYFYKVNDTFGYQNYFGIIPIFNGNSMIGTFVLDLKTQPYNYNVKFPDVLSDGKISKDSDYDQYSFAFYNHGKLISQSGKYTYDLVNDDFKSEVGKITYNNEKDNGINHLIYAPTASKVIVISKDKLDYVTRIAALSFFFLVFIIYSAIVFVLIWGIKNFEDSSFNWFNINKYLMINANQILYKTRIQVSIIFVVVATLTVVGWTTFYYISKEYRIQQFDEIQNKIRKIQVSFENQVSKEGLRVTGQTTADFDQFADVNGVFLNLYSSEGDLIMTSLPRMFDSGLQIRKMDAVAFTYLSKLQRSEFINDQSMIGDFQYATAFVPIKNVNEQTVAYLGSPFFSNKQDYDNKVNLFINTLVNIYALVFVVIGILAVFLANQITNPLTFIQQSIRKTKLGRRNEPIQWSRHDEIGSLIKEYNKMIAALEVSAKKLAKSERENAWREMAKQVAHEIKNPLTPLKLGVQLLERSWKEKDVNFEKKFENFNKSFIEQIDSLAKIASEFSSFAKMPDTKLEHIELIPIVEKASDVYNQSENAEINIVNRLGYNPTVLGDKDQFLRMFNNLFKNAIEAGSDAKSVVINVLIHESDHSILLSISDNGRGINEEERDLIFAPNFTTKSSGTGLGLAFVKQAIENAGGEIYFTSGLGKGTTFYLSFPAI